MRALELMRGTRVVATALALANVRWPAGTIVLRTAPDEILAFPACSPNVSGDPHAIVDVEEGFVGAWFSADEADRILEHHCEWEVPAVRPAFAQGAIAELPAKLWLERDRVLILVPAPYAAEFTERIA